MDTKERNENKSGQAQFQADEVYKILQALRACGDLALKPEQIRYLKCRRCAELLLSVSALLLLSPLFLTVIVIQKISSPGEPVFFRQQRVGRYGKSFSVIKFRSMKQDAPSMVATEALEHPEQYITPFGRFLRKSSIDELPQLWNVVRGEMSLIGPRPLIIDEEEIQLLRWYYGIYAVRPGITGWAQVNGRDLVNIYEKVRYDREYVRGVGLKMDLKVLLKSVLVVFGHIGYQEGETQRQS